MKKLLIIIGATLVLISGLTFYAFATGASERLNWKSQDRDKAPVTASDTNTSTKLSVEDLLKAVNKERHDAGVPVLAIDTRLNNSAQKKADEMFITGVYGHVNSKGVRGYTYAEQATDFTCDTVSENLVWDTGTLSLEDAMASWMNSPAHRDAILDAKYSLTGFGIANNIAVQHFCSL